jgi:hypothetical protein
MPVSMATLPLDDGAKFKMWRETFVTKIILAYGTVFSVNIFILLLPLISKMHIDGVGGFGNSMFLIFMIIGGAMVIPAGQNLFARLFGTADDMHAGGSFLHSAFYGGRIAGAMTFGAAFKLIRGATHIGKGISGKVKAAKEKKDDDSDKFSEDKDTSSSETSEGQSDGGGSE